MINDIKEKIDDADNKEDILKIIDEYNIKKTSLKDIYLIDDEYIMIYDGNDIYADIEKIINWIYDVDIDEYKKLFKYNFNRDFWSSPDILYHATNDANVKSILQKGLLRSNSTRGSYNKNVGLAIFTVNNIDLLKNGSYGENIFEINSLMMKNDGFMPFVSEEPTVEEYNIRTLILNKLGLSESEYLSFDNEYYIETIIIYDDVPKKYLKLLN